MAFVFRLAEGIQGNCNCEGCAEKIKNYIRKVGGVKSVVVNRIQDDNGDYKVSVIVKGSFDPNKIIRGVEIQTKRVIELVSSTIDNKKANQVEPIKVKSSYATPIAKNPKDSSLDHDLVKDPSAPVAQISKDLPLGYNGIIGEPWKKLDKLASNNLEKAHRLRGLINKCEDLKDQLDAARARQNELGKQKRDILNHGHRNASLPQRSRGRKAKKKDESQVLYGKLARREMKLDDFVCEYKQLRIKNYEQMRQSPAN